MPAEFDKLRLAIKKQLKKDNPNLSEKELEDRSYAIAVAQWKKTHGGKSPTESTDDINVDEDGREVVAENVKFYIGAGIGTVTNE